MGAQVGIEEVNHTIRGKYAPCISRKVEPQVIVSRSAPGNSQERKGSGMGRVAIALGISLGIIILADI